MAGSILMAINTETPVRVLAVIGAFTIGAFALARLLELLARVVFRQKLPTWALWGLRVLGGGACAWITALVLFGGGGTGIGGSGGFGLGAGTGSGPENGTGTKESATKEKGKVVVKEPPPDPTPVDEKAMLRVEVLGDAPLARLAKATTFDAARRYRVENENALRTLEEIKELIRQGRERQPALRRLVIVLYLDSPERQRPQVSSLVEWANDLEARPGKLEVDFTEKNRHAPTE